METSILEARQRDTRINASFEQHVLQARKRIFALANRVVGNTSDAEDITQETFLRAWTHYADFDSTRPFDAWVARIAMNLCIDYKRHQKRKPFSLDTVVIEETHQETSFQEPGDSTNDPAVRLLSREIDERLLVSINQLPKPHRQCVMLLNAERSYEEIARILDCPLGTVRSRVHRARTKVRQTLETLKAV